MLTSYSNYKSVLKNNGNNSNNSDAETSPTLEESLCFDLDDSDNDVTCRQVGTSKYKRLNSSPKVVIDEEDVDGMPVDQTEFW